MLLTKESRGFEVYLNFIKNAIRGLDIALLPSNKISLLLKLQGMLLNDIQNLIRI